MIIGANLTGTYTYSDNENDPEGITIFQWYRADDNNGTNEVAINGATSASYTLQAPDKDKYIVFEVTPVAQSGTSPGSSVRSGYKGPIFQCGDTLIDGRDGQHYATIQIGDQCWMAQNLNIGTKINSSRLQINNNVIEKYCYNDDVSNCSTYGGLYQFLEAVQYSTLSNNSICPTGWHLPSDYEWKILETQLGMSPTDAWNTGWRGTDEGSKIAGNEALWQDGALDQNPNFGVTGFNALPSGYFDPGISYNGINSNTIFWTTTQLSSSYFIYVRALNSNQSKIKRSYVYYYSALSIRCIKD